MGPDWFINVIIVQIIQTLGGNINQSWDKRDSTLEKHKGVKGFYDWL